MNRINLLISFLSLLLLFNHCAQEVKETKRDLLPDATNGDIQIPENFGALVVADDLGRGRHLVVRDNGDVYVHLRKLTDQGYAILAMRDTTGDGKVDEIKGFSKVTGTGIALHNGYLYYASSTEIYRSPLPEGQLVPDNQVDTLVHMVEGSGHMEKTFTFDNKGNMYVNIGSASNACQEETRTKHSPGKDPCLELETRAGIWRFSDSQLGQQQDLDHRYATGLRNCVAVTWNFDVDKLYAVMHGRDDLHRFWPEYFTEDQNVDLPAEEFVDIEEGDNFGWPYCFYNQFKNQLLLNPEYGGDGEKVGRCADAKDPLLGFPGHWAPNDLLFYQGNLFPEKYKHGAFIAFHGSWNRLGHPQAGFNVVFVPIQEGKPTGEYEVFADGFKGSGDVESSGDARFRPCGLAEGPDGSLYVVDDQKGRVWRIMYYPNGVPKMMADASTDQPADNAEVSDKATHSEEVPPALMAGKTVYDSYCIACHMHDGKGAPGMNPPLIGTKYVLGDKDQAIKVVLEGLSEPVEIQGETFQNAMPSHAFLSNKQIADVLTFVRQSWGNDAGEITEENVAQVRQSLGNQ